MRPLATNEELEDQYLRNMTNWTPDQIQIDRIVEVRTHAKQLGHAIVYLCPPSRERERAIELLEEATMRAVQSIVTEHET